MYGRKNKSFSLALVIFVLVVVYLGQLNLCKVKMVFCIYKVATMKSWITATSQSG